MTTSPLPPNQPTPSDSNPQLYLIVGFFSCLGFILCVAAITLAAGFSLLLRNARQSAPIAAPIPPSPLPAEPIPTASPATDSQEQAAEITVFCELFGTSPESVEAGQPVILTWGWRAASEAYRQDYIDAASFSLYIDDENVDVSSVTPVLSSQSNDFFATWSLPPRTFTAGKHQTILQVTLSRQLTDGLDLDNDGNLDLYGPGPTPLPPCDIIVAETSATEPPPIHDTDLPQAQWPLILLDTFDTSDNGWPEFSDFSGTEPETFDVRNGKYSWSVQSEPGSLGVGWPFTADNSREVSDFYATVEAKVTGEIKDATYGLVFRNSETGNYLFGLNDQDLLTVEAVVYNQTNNILIKPTESPAVQSGEANRLSVVAVGSHFRFYINDRLVAELDDDTLQSGTVGIYVGLTGGEALAEVEFDNFELHAP